MESNVPKAVGQRRRKEGDLLSDSEDEDEFDKQIESNMPKPVGQRSRRGDPPSDNEEDHDSDEQLLQDDIDEANDPFYLENIARNASARGLVEEAVAYDEESTADEEDSTGDEEDEKDEEDSTTEKEDSPMFFPERSI